MAEKVNVHVGGRIPHNLAAQITRAREQTGMSQTAFLRRAIEMYLWMEGDLPKEVIKGIRDVAAQNRMTINATILKCLEDGIINLSLARCRNCAMLNDIGSNYCSNCGMPLNPEAREALLHLEGILEEYPTMIQHYLNTRKT